MRFFVWLFVTVLGVVFDLFIAFLLVILLNIVGIPFLDALSYWQCFGLLFAFGLFNASARLGEELSEAL